MRVAVLLFFASTLLLGCASQDAARTSHFEHDHEVAAHWPDDLADAAAKIRERLERADHDQSRVDEPGHPRDGDSHGDGDLTDEITDLVGWVPEIAADTNLTEQDWIPLDNAAKSLSAQLRASDHQLTPSNREQAIALCELIEQSLAKIPERIPPLRVPSQ